MEKIFLGLKPNDKTGTPARIAGAIINANFDYLEGRIENITRLSYSAGFVLNGQELTFNIGWQWIINSVNYINPEAVVITIPFAAAGLQRIDYLVLNSSDTFTRVAGAESASNPVAPVLPVDTVQATIVLVNDAAVSSAESGVGSNSLYDANSPTTVAVGEYPKGTNITGVKHSILLQQIFAPYLSPSFSLVPPEVTGQPDTVEVGTTLSGVKTFTWGTKHDDNIKPNTIAIYDITAVAYLAQSLANDGTESLTINTLKLNSGGSTQQYKAEGTNTKEVVFTSQIRTITARFIRYYGAQAVSAANSAAVKSLPTNEFQTANENTFILNTGTVEKKFQVALPPARTISEVIDLETNANITADYTLIGTVNVTDADGANRLYNFYEMNLGAPYSANHRHQIKTI
jgi:hypothetical protein